MNKYLPLALILAFFLISYVAFIDSKGEDKNKIYLKIKKYSPYFFEKGIGGLVIKSKLDKNFKEKPSNMQVFHEMDSLQKEWGRSHLRVEDNYLVIYDRDKIIKTIKINDKSEIDFLHKFYGIK